MNYLTKEDILSRTDHGADIIISVYPNARFDNKPFKIREEKTASARCKLIKDQWCVTDFGDEVKARNCFDILILEIPGIDDFKDAIKYINEEFFGGGDMAPAAVRKKAKAPKADNVVNIYKLKFKKFTKAEFDLLGINQKTADIFNIKSLKSYTLRKEKKIDDKPNELVKQWNFESSAEDPYFAIDYSPEEKDEALKTWKIYKPKGDKKYKFVYTGPRPENFLYGWLQLEEDELDDLIIAAGEKDVWNLRRKGFFAVCLNSETALLKGEEYKQLKEKCEQLYVCYDIDNTGQRKAEGLCEFYRSIINIKLPVELANQYDFRGSSCTDVTDYFRHWKGNDFTELIVESKRIYFENLKKLHSFYAIKTDKNGDYNGISIQKDGLIDLLMQFGFYSYDVDEDTSRFVIIEKNLIKGVNRKIVVTKFLNYIRSLPKYKHTWTFTKGETLDKDKIIGYNTIRKALMNSFPTLFNQDTMLNTMIPDQEIEIKNDIKTTKFFYFKNGWVAVSARGRKFYPYKYLDKFIWKDQILDREFTHHEKPTCPTEFEKHRVIEAYLKDERISVFERFFWDITRNIIDDGGEYNWHRNHSLKTIIGYNLHNYYSTKLYTTILTDAKMSEDGEPNGRTGKDLVFQFAGKMLNATEGSKVFTEVGGKEFKISNKHRYELCNMETQFVLITDVYRNFNLEIIFPDITSGIPVNKKNDKPFQIKAKIGITANKSIRIDGESAKDRVIQFELSDHFNSDHSPLTKFGHWFGTEWDDQEWLRFDNFMIECLEEYFKQLRENPKTIGIYRTESINLRERTLREHTAKEFVGWFADKTEGLKHNHDYYKKEMFEEFTDRYEDFKKDIKFKQATFTSWVNSYCKSFPEIFIKVESKRNGSKGDSFVFSLRTPGKVSTNQSSSSLNKENLKELVF